jgi:nitrite reductase/ring-hydroxylating ferredoxin subunit
MNWKIIAGVTFISLLLVLAACAGQVPAASTKPLQAPAAQPANTGAGPTQQVTTAAPAPEPVRPPKPSGPIKAKEITATVSIDSVSIPVSVVQSNWNTHFLVDTQSGTMGFMAYALNDEIVVRASICPPCRGKTYSLSGTILVCDTCGTTFDAKTGIGISGACVNYPKASVPYNLSGGNIVMKITDLQTAYQNTLKPGLP